MQENKCMICGGPLTSLPYDVRKYPQFVLSNIHRVCLYCRSLHAINENEEIKVSKAEI